MEKWINADAVNAALNRIREEAWLHDIPSPTVPEYIEHHDAIQQIMLVIDKERKLLNDAADVAPVRHGRWERDEMTGFYICSVCNNGYEEQPTLMGKPMFEYCPVCGAKMLAQP